MMQRKKGKKKEEDDASIPFLREEGEKKANSKYREQKIN